MTVFDHVTPPPARGARPAHPAPGGSRPAVLGGEPAFPEGLPLTVVRVPDSDAALRRIRGALDSGQLTNGPLVAELEEAVAELVGVEHVVAVASCTAGLMLTLQALGARGPVVMPSFSFSATAHAAAWVGGRPVFAEIEPASLTLDPADAAARLADAADTDGTADGSGALMATHVYGTPCRVEELEAVAGSAGVPLVYDAAHALGSRRAGRPVGGFGTAEVFSMSPTKVAVAGEGGLVTTRDAELARTLRIARNYGNPGDYDCLFPGLNARMSELHAAVGLGALPGLPERVAHRGALADAFAERVAGVPGLRLPRVAPGDVSTHKDLTLVLDADAFGLSARQLAAGLRAEGVDTRRYFHPPVHRQRAYAHLGQADGLPLTDRLADSVLTVPLWSQMHAGTVRRIADAVLRLHAHAAEVRAAGVPAAG
ncbi:DegT/DnrJ/EryC1/StrS family aminotransferase [Allostreptomyces psammosilenae]|uniref:dTDP-4-amino-4,6-dideoxygalactose transaminase n=1 Tax=Allostreptomyces psammosilenae TaxID=1892865 RepID=A0A853AAP9_9ACTN|nr:DegT/DnrJ/EryC1/StrS family aminotransferase [Allostreptomyces psammosilenae]NYI07452.1 dTDP-4-amino-4,6-dideoxygalactose transaminase [Allostreptomyces psammosilenae]